MDKKLIFSGGEPKIENPDLMYMQYSNYFALQANAQGLDPDNAGMIFYGCEVSATFQTLDNLVTAGISDGYMVIGGEMIKVLNTAEVEFAVTFVGGSLVTYYIYAQPDITYNILGNKTFIDGTARKTWQETRIVLSGGNSPVPPTGRIVVAKLLVNDASTVVEVTPVALKPAEVGNRATEASTAEMYSRNGVNSKVVTPNALYDSFANFNIYEIASSTKTVAVVPDGARYDFYLPTGITNFYFLSAYAYGSSTSGSLYNTRVGCSAYRNWTGTEPNKDDDEYVTWVYDSSTRILSVYWQIHPTDLGNTAYATVLITRS